MNLILEYKLCGEEEVLKNHFELDGKDIKTENFNIKIDILKAYKMILEPLKKITILNCTLDFIHIFNKEDKILLNGYQSWTDSSLVKLNHKDKVFSPLLKKIINKYKFQQYGDYKFYKAKNEKGVFHSVNYSYVSKLNKEVFFIGSLSDNDAFTFIEFNTLGNKISLTRDFQGKAINKKIDLFNMYVEKGEKNTIFNEYFKRLNLKQKEKKIFRGWTSWYNYYENISEDIILKNLNNFKEKSIKLDYFQIDDGYQSAVGDWLSINNKFPKGMAYLAREIKNTGFKAGIWLAPFSAETKSQLVKEHPDWILKDENGEFVYGGSNWSQFYALDIYNKEFQEYLKEVFHVLIEKWGYEMFKLDFLYSACLLPRKNKTRAEVMHDAMKLLREIIGDKEIIACGVPIYSAMGLVEFCRIGCDVGLDWDDKFYMKYFHRERISTKNALKNTISRYELDSYAFYNDPDVFLLRDTNIKLSKNQKETLFWINQLFGTLLFTSDNISQYNKEQEKLYMKGFEIYTREILSVEKDNDFYKISVLLNNKKMEFLINLSSKAKIFNGRKVEGFSTIYY